MTQSSFAQTLYLVLGGELEQLDGTCFRDPSRVDVVGVFADQASANVAWKAKAQGSVDNAHMRYFVVDISASVAQAAIKS